MKTIVCLLIASVVFSSVVQASFVKKLAKHFHDHGKDKKDEQAQVVLKKCDVIWEEKVTPLCKSVNHPHCHTEWRDECHKEYDTECWNVDVEECTSEKRCEWVTEKQCKTEYTVTCDDHHQKWRKKRSVELPEDVDDVEIESVSEDLLSDPEIEKMLTKSIDITGMSDDEIAQSLLGLTADDSAEEETLDSTDVSEKDDISHSRKKRHLLLQGAGATALGLGAAGAAGVGAAGVGAAGLGAAGLGAAGLAAGPAVGLLAAKKVGLGGAGLLAAKKFGLGGGIAAAIVGGIKKKFKKFQGDDEPVVQESICHHHPNTNCWDEPREKCWNEPTCHVVPKEQCKQVPRDVCSKVDFEKCEDVWEEQCEYVKTKVAKKHCRDENW